MTRFLILRKADPHTEADDTPSEELVTAMMRYTDELITAGIMQVGEGLQPSRKGARLKFLNGATRVIDGPFAETKELIAGFSVFETESKQAAIDLIKRWPTIDGHGNVEIEIREVACSEPNPAHPTIAASAGLTRFIVMMKSSAAMEAGIPPPADLLAKMQRYTAQSIQNGVPLGGNGLKPSTQGARVKFAEGKPKVIDGPFAETKELIAGYWLIQARSLAAAIDWVRGFPEPPNAHIEFEIEIRRLYEMSDFGDEFTPVFKEQEERLHVLTTQK